MNVAVVGATGVIGRRILEKAESYGLRCNDLYLFATEKSEGTFLKPFGEKIIVEKLSVENVIKKQIDLAFFAAGSRVSEEFAPLFLEKGAFVIDNSSRYRMQKGVPLIVPSVNGELLTTYDKLIANPNCSTITLVPILNALKGFGLKRVLVSTYQAVSGAGKSGVEDLKRGEQGLPQLKFEKPIYGNLIPKIGDFDEAGYCEEEMKIVNESKKILNDENLKISATTVRVPVFNCHSESVNVEFESEVSLSEIKNALLDYPDITLTANEKYATPLEVNNRDDVVVSRIRKDSSCRNAIWLWAVSDNLNVGAATNAVKIAKILQNLTK